MNCLAIESAGLSCSLALLVDGEVHHYAALAERRHGELILPWADALLATAGIGRHQLDAIALSRGPGSFTSLRLGLSAGLAIAFALDIPVYPISTLAALAQQAVLSSEQGFSHCYAMLDARMGEVYAAQYQRVGTGLQRLGEEMLVAPAACPAPREAGEWLGAGNGFTLAPTLPWLAQLKGIASDIWPSAVAMLSLLEQSRAVAAELFEPVYLRDRVAQPAVPR